MVEEVKRFVRRIRGRRYKIMDLSAPTMSTFGGHCCSSATLTNATGDMKLQHFIYGGAGSAIRRMYVDDFRVTDYQGLP